MGKNFTAVFAVCLAISSLPLACGDDEDDGGSGGKATGGSGGKATGGSGGKATGGSSGSSGSGGKGGGGQGGSAGKATGGSAGTVVGGAGGSDDGGMGGEGGSGGPMSFTCEQLCDWIEAEGGCSDNSMCEVEICQIALGPACEDEVQAFHDCFGNGPTSNIACMTNKPIYTYGTGTCDDEFDAALYCVP